MSDFDGIKEREQGKKKMPLGMTLLFAGLVLCGLVYLYLYTPAISGWTQRVQYEEKTKAHAALVPAKHAEVEGAESAAHEQREALERGRKIYQESCAMCHGAKLEGGVGPSLSGPKFTYGSSVQDHIRVISTGTPKGMPGFESQLGAEKIYNVASYLYEVHKH
jgi:cytochrome c oxidase cbb3-type subunit 3